jgi:hypothetical protein
MSDPIRAGYYLKARCIEQSDIAHAPPHAREVFDYFLRKAFWKDGDQLKRGQLLTNYKAIQDDLRWYVGNRPMRYKRHEIETAVKLLARTGAVTTARTTRGMIVTVCKYSFYQSQENYENHSEPVLKPTRNCNENPPVDETVQTGESLKDSTPAPEGFPHDLFARFQKAHSDCARVRDFQFQTALAAVPGANVAEAVEAFERQVAGAASLRFPVREFEKYLRRSVGKEDGGREFPQKNAAPVSADEEQLRAAIRARLQQRPAGEVSQAERMKQKAEERARKQCEASTHEESED